ncbi:DUF72 domain-containing protein [Acidianus brierleyi]|uniref:DUF72 domain-containing protein n=1 Tax=Acidianus brierleyi TaxID=41673 RepID=A0A2U9IH06_9CREN|nr:DUF72 domain-containing protein [Acidianus brierleyi]AWR95280.1 DUF72 domain-containing protein [Acidianus brierleyi]
MIYVGTSGWVYDWNEKGNLDWYVKNSGLNAVELNMSFYRFPFKNQVKSWKKYSIKWSVKVNRYITHVKRMKDMESWERFYELMEDLHPDFYLFQLPPNFKYSDENLKRVKEFSSILKDRMAVEFRENEWYDKLPKLDCTIVSIDSPIGTYIVNTSGKIYLRMHGREDWYNYEYRENELLEIAERIKDKNPNDVYVFFNNDHYMLDNARKMREILDKMFKV